MADNVTLPATGTGTADVTVASDDVSGVQFQKVKLVDGTADSSTAIPGDATNGLDVDVTRLPSGTVAGSSSLPSGTNAIGKLAANDGVDIGDVTINNATGSPVPVGGNVAHDAADSGNPEKIGYKAKSALSGVTLVADADRVDATGDLDGAAIGGRIVPLGDIKTERVSDTGGTSTAFSTFGAGGTGVRNYLSSLTVYNDSTTNGFLDIRDGTGGSVLLTVPLPAKGGAHLTFPLPFRQATANTALAYDVSAALTTVYITAVGFQSKA